MPEASRLIRFRVICDGPPTRADVEFGLQDKDGRLGRGRRRPDGSLAFETEARAVEGSGGAITLRGRAVHGPPAARFLYLSARAAGDPSAPWLFRMKVPLPDVAGAGEGTDSETYEVRITATGGGTVRLPDPGWVRR